MSEGDPEECETADDTRWQVVMVSALMALPTLAVQLQVAALLRPSQPAAWQASNKGEKLTPLQIKPNASSALVHLRDRFQK